MNNAFLVSMLHRMADIDEKGQPVSRREFMGVTVVGEGDSLHEFHDEVGPAVGGGAAIEYLGDVWVLHDGQRFPLGVEAGHHLSGVHSRFDHFECHASANGLRLLGYVHQPHTALRQYTQYAIRANTFRVAPKAAPLRLSA